MFCRRKSTLGLVTVLSVMTASSHVHAQEAKEALPAARTRPLPVKDFDVPLPDSPVKLIGLNAESNRPVLGRPTVPVMDRRYYYLPLFALQEDEKGELQVTATGAGDIVLPIVFERGDLRRIFREHLEKEKLLDHTATEGQIQIISAKVFYIETDPSYVPSMPSIFD
jgi:hypothetical protein